MHLIVPEKLHEKLPLTARQQAGIDEHRSSIKSLISGKDRRLALVLGPCSIHDLSSALEYGRRFRALAEKVAPYCLCVMRVYVEKPRTTTGWKGLVYDPHLDGSGDLQTGIFWARELFLTLTDLGIPIATEILHPLLAPFFSDLISWGFVGARTSASQPHRELASSLPFAVGFKNSPDGNIQQAIQAMTSVRQPHRFPSIGPQGTLIAHESAGNPHTHVVLRGSSTSTNYDPTTLAQTAQQLMVSGFKQRILVDCSHGNCHKEFSRQKEVFVAVLEQHLQGNTALLGMMLESHLEEGSQFLTESPSSLHYGVSVTDPCLSWSDTESLVRTASDRLSSSNVIR
ncbi:MAG: 3-deoxy-7-phosphoheptulonate synthase [Rhabdochlamydiaceae bacterium]